VGQRWQPCLRRGRVESAKSGAVGKYRRSVGDYYRLAYRLLKIAVSFELE
jgi:hypothetical protein